MFVKMGSGLRRNDGELIIKSYVIALQSAIHRTGCANRSGQACSLRWAASLVSVNGTSLYHSSGLRRNDGELIIKSYVIALQSAIHRTGCANRSGQACSLRWVPAFAGMTES